MSEHNIPPAGPVEDASIAYQVAHAIKSDMDMHLTDARTMNPGETLKLGMRIGETMAHFLQTSEHRPDGTSDDNVSPRQDTSDTTTPRFLIPHTSLEIASRVSVDELTATATNRAELGARIADVTEPYNRLFRSMLPPPTDNKRSIFGNLKTDPVTLPKWHTVITDDNWEYVYHGQLAYQPGESTNMATGFLLGVQTNYHRLIPNGIKLHATLSQGQVSKIRLGGWSPMDSDITRYDRDLYSGNPLVRRVLGYDGGQARTLGNLLANIAPYIGSAHIFIGQDNPTIKFAGSRGCKYVYDAASDHFTLIGSPQHAEPQQDAPAIIYNRPATLSVEQFSSIVSSALAMIPTIEET